MFIEQTVREALPPMRYDLPLDLKRQLQAQGQLHDISLETLEHYRREYFQQPSQKVLEAVAKSQHAVILGDLGAGKSTLLQYLALDWAEGKKDAITHSKAIQNLADNLLLLTMMAILNLHCVKETAFKLIVEHYPNDTKNARTPA